MRVRAMRFATANGGSVEAMFQVDNNTLVLVYKALGVTVEIPLTIHEAQALQNSIPLIIDAKLAEKK